MRRLAFGILAGTGILISFGPAMAGSVTTRVETRPFYGATVTLEEGVRVFRPLPPHDRVIINPNKTPLYLGINETDVRAYNENHNYHYGGDDRYPSYYGGWGNFVPSGKGRKRPVRRHSRGGGFPAR
jgi:hypothetical protein